MYCEEHVQDRGKVARPHTPPPIHYRFDAVDLEQWGDISRHLLGFVGHKHST